MLLPKKKRGRVESDDAYRSASHEWLASALTERAVSAEDPRVAAALRSASTDGHAAAAEAAVEDLVASGAAAEQDLALVLIARALEAQAITRDRALVIVDRRALLECRRIVERLHGLRSVDANVADFATELRVKVVAAAEWMAVRPQSVAGSVTAVTGVVALPVATIASGSLGLVIAGGVIGAALLSGLLFVHRKQRWVVDARLTAPYVTRGGS